MCTRVPEIQVVSLGVCLVSWTFLTNHADALLCIARDPGVRLRDLALRVGVTERAAQRIVNDLVAAGYVSRARVGSRNVYTVNPDRHLRRPIVRHSRITALLALLDDEAEDRRVAPAHGPL